MPLEDPRRTERPVNELVKITIYGRTAALQQIELPRHLKPRNMQRQTQMRALKNTIKALLLAVLLPVVYGQSTNPPTLLIQPASRPGVGINLFLQVAG
jgi:hypothetical protein